MEPITAGTGDEALMLQIIMLFLSVIISAITTILIFQNKRILFNQQEQQVSIEKIKIQMEGMKEGNSSLESRVNENQNAISDIKIEVATIQQRLHG